MAAVEWHALLVTLLLFVSLLVFVYMSGELVTLQDDVLNNSHNSVEQGVSFHSTHNGLKQVFVRMNTTPGHLGLVLLDGL